MTGCICVICARNRPRQACALLRSPDMALGPNFVTQPITSRPNPTNRYSNALSKLQNNVGLCHDMVVALDSLMESWILNPMHAVTVDFVEY